MKALKYIFAMSLVANMASADSTDQKSENRDESHEQNFPCETELNDAHRLLVTNCGSVKASMTTERGDSIQIESHGKGNSIVIRMSSSDQVPDDQNIDDSDSMRQKQTVEEEILRLLKRRERSPEAIQKHLDRLKKRDLENKVDQSGCSDDQLCVDVITEYPIDELKLETSK